MQPEIWIIQFVFKITYHSIKINKGEISFKKAQYYDYSKISIKPTQIIQIFFVDVIMFSHRIAF